jgi:hypothetical protein
MVLVLASGFALILLFVGLVVAFDLPPGGTRSSMTTGTSTKASSRLSQPKASPAAATPSQRSLLPIQLGYEGRNGSIAGAGSEPASGDAGLLHRR